MATSTLKSFTFAAVTSFIMIVLIEPASAATLHHKHPIAHHHVRARHHVASGSEITRIAQRQLSDLGYYDGDIDGVMGPQTRAAIKKFQSEHNLKPDGVVGSKTRRAMAAADASTSRVHGNNTIMPSVVKPDPNAEVNQDYMTAQNNDAKIISSRFARLDVKENGNGPSKRYTVNLNGQSILAADGQASVIGMSTTYDMGSEDAVIFTTFSPSDTGCIYRNHVLIMSNAGSKIHDIGNCTRAYHAQVTNGSLYISFTELDDARAVGAVWRVEGDSVERL